MLPSTKELNYFYEVALALNFSKAAKLLNTSQPALSMAVKRLEEKLDIQLFYRQNEGLSLTLEGKALFSEVSELIKKWEGVKSNIQSISDDLKGEVTIGCHAVQGFYMTKIVSGLISKYPGVKINLKYDFSQNICEGLLNKSFDIGVVVNPMEHRNISFHRVRTSALAFWSNQPKLSHQDFQDSTIFSDLSIPLIRGLIERLRLKKIPHGKISDISSFEMIGNLATSGAGIAVLPDCFVESHYKDSLNRLYDLPYLTSILGFAYRKDSNKQKCLKTILDDLKEYARIRQKEIVAFHAEAV